MWQLTLYKFRKYNNRKSNMKKSTNRLYPILLEWFLLLLLLLRYRSSLLSFFSYYISSSLVFFPALFVTAVAVAAVGSVRCGWDRFIVYLFVILYRPTIKCSHIIRVQSRKSEYNGNRLFKPPPSYLCKCHVISCERIWKQQRQQQQQHRRKRRTKEK